MKKVLALVSSFLIIGGMQANAADAPKPPLGNIAVVNVQQVLQQSPKIADINKKLQDQFKTRQQKLLAEQKSLQDEMDKFKQESPTMSQKDKDSTQKKIAADQADLVKQVTAFQQDLNKEQNKQMQGVLSQLNQIISNLAKKSDYSLVLDSQAVIYAKDSSDITKQVATEFNGK
jgi:outer membrane protein